MPRSRSSHGHRYAAPVRVIDGCCSTSIEKWKDPASRTFIVVKFSMIKTLRGGERGFQLHGDSTNLGNWRGALKARECPPNSGHHVVYAALPKKTDVQYKWMLMSSDNCTVKEKEQKRCISLGDSDLTVQDVFGVYSSLLPQVFQPDYHPLDQVLMPVAFVTNHKVPNISSQAVAVIGSTPELGRWRAMNARAMFEVEPDKWATILYLPKGLRFRYKFIIIEKSRTKRIIYGERKEHWVHLDGQICEDGTLSQEAGARTDEAGALSQDAQETERDENLHGIWTPVSNSNLSVQHVEEQSMGSVASDISLGTRPSLGDHLSDINEDVMDMTDPFESHDLTYGRQQTSILEEIKEELYGTSELADFLANETESQPLIAFNDLSDRAAAIEAESRAQLPDESETKSKICTDWLAAQPADNDPFEDNPDFNTPLCTPYTDMTAQSVALVSTFEDVPLEEAVTARLIENESQTLAEADPEDKEEECEADIEHDETESNTDSECAETILQAETRPTTETISTTGVATTSDAIPTLGAEPIPISETSPPTDVIRSPVVSPPTDVIPSPEVSPPTDVIRRPEVSPPTDSTPPIDTLPSVTADATPIAETTQTVEASQSVDRAAESYATCTGAEGIKGSCTSLNTSTIRLPCYCTDNQDSLHIARKLAGKLPWILDLPVGLMSRVLHSVGIMNKTKQNEIARHLQLPKEELLVGDMYTVVPLGRRRHNSPLANNKRNGI